MADPDGSPPDLEEPTDLIRSAILQLEEGHPASDQLPMTTWIARVCEQASLLAVAVDVHGSEHRKPPDDATWQLIARLSAVGAEAIRAAARHHPDAREGESILVLVDWTLVMIDEAAEDPDATSSRNPLDALIGTLAMLGGASAAAIEVDAAERGETKFEDRASAVHIEPDEDLADTFSGALFNVAEICRSGIAWSLEGL